MQDIENDKYGAFGSCSLTAMVGEQQAGATKQTIVLLNYALRVGETMQTSICHQHAKLGRRRDFRQPRVIH
jgi:hypothetical protein